MIQGAANYAWNLIEEALALIWKPSEAPRENFNVNEAKPALETENGTRDLGRGDKARNEREGSAYRKGAIRKD
jgi:hypothetical protein